MFRFIQISALNFSPWLNDRGGAEGGMEGGRIFALALSVKMAINLEPTHQFS